MTDASAIEANKRIGRRVLLEIWSEGRLEVGVEPTGRTISYTGVDINRVVDGRIVESWVQYDALGLLQQLGIVPPLQTR